MGWGFFSPSPCFATVVIHYSFVAFAAMGHSPIGRGREGILLRENALFRVTEEGEDNFIKKLGGGISYARGQQNFFLMHTTFVCITELYVFREMRKGGKLPKNELIYNYDGAVFSPSAIF